MELHYARIATKITTKRGGINLKLICEAGSCHLNRLDYGKELIDLAVEVNAHAIKFQLIDPYFEFNKDLSGKDAYGNYILPATLFSELVEYTRSLKSKTEIFASAFTEEAIQLLYDLGIKKVKLSYANAFNLKLIRKAKKLDMEIWASGDSTNYPEYADVRLFCNPIYPVKAYDGAYASWHHIYEGFSSHYLGYKTDVRILREYDDWEYLEKHITLDRNDIDCPDHWFALLPKELKELVKCLNG